MLLEAIRSYYAACNRGDAEAIAAICAPDVVHYFSKPGVEPVAGGDHLGRYWRKVQALIGAEWHVDRGIEQGDEAVIEWTMFWTDPQTGARGAVRGAEWYLFREGRIVEIRAYYDQEPGRATGLVGFPYSERGYAGF